MAYPEPVASTDWLEETARAFEPAEQVWATPGELAKHIDSRVRNTPALDLVDAELMDLPDTKRLMVFMPPQEGKSQRCSRTYPTWLLTQDPTLRIGIVSYESEIALRWGRDIKMDLEMHPELGITVREDSRAAGRWETKAGGGVYCVGIGGALAGKPIDVLIIDDPVKDREQAESATYRERNWNWWESVGSTRLSRRGRVVLMTTRWHKDDLAGRILEREPGEWRVVKIPAIADSPDDPLGRPIGMELESATKEPGHFYTVRKLRSPYVWRSVYQQSPTSAEGGLFVRGDWRYWSPLHEQVVRLGTDTTDLRDCQKFITMDLAASTKTSADYTVASCWAITLNGDLMLLDRTRARVTKENHFDMVEGLRSRWLGPYDVVYVESRMFGTTVVYQAGRSGIPIMELEADVDKLTRALPAANLQRQHRIWLPEGASWLQEWEDEHADFPSVAHDDQVDTTAYAARVTLAYWLPQDPAGTLPVSRTSSAPSGMDFMSVPL